MAAKTFALLLLCLSVCAGALRSHAVINASDAEASSLSCMDYCVQCNDGSTVWYGRSKSWFRTFINLVTEGIVIPLTALGNVIVKVNKEQYKGWFGGWPTTGFFCEKVDVIKFDAGQGGLSYTPLMLADLNWFGRIMLNELKPYDDTGAMKQWAQPDDKKVYKAGCKVMKAAGMKGSAKQFKAIFQDTCDDSVTKSVHTCSQHSRLCGSAGGVKQIINGVWSWSQCSALKGSTNTDSMCPGLR